MIDGEVSGGRAVSVIHENRDDVRDVAVLDAVVNNGDRKGSHLQRDRVGALWGFDHGVTLSADPKLRTVLWGWAGEPLRDVDVVRLERLQGLLDDPGSRLSTDLARLLPRDDVARSRAADDEAAPVEAPPASERRLARHPLARALTRRHTPHRHTPHRHTPHRHTPAP